MKVQPLIKMMVFLMTYCLLTAVPTCAAKGNSDMPNSVRWLLTDVGQLIDQKAYDQAVEKLLKFQAKGGPLQADGSQSTDVHHHPMVYFALGNCRLLMEQYSLAEKAFQEVIRRQPDNGAACLNLAKAYYEHGLYVKAAQAFKTAYALCPEKSPDALYYSAAAYLMAQDYKLSIAAFEQLMAAHPEQMKPAWKSNWIHALISDGQSRRALPYIVELIDLCSGDQRIRWQETLVHQYLQLKMEKKAQAYTEQLTREAPIESRWWKLLSQIRLYTGNYADALAALTIYGYLKPLTVEEKKIWADLNLNLGIPAQAAPIYTDLLADARDSATIKKLVSAFRQLGRSADALPHLEKWPQLEKDAELMMLRADLLYEMKQYKDAAAAYRQAAQTDDTPHCGKAWLMAGYAAWQDKDLGPSRQAFQRAAKFRKQRKTALSAIEQLETMN